MNVCAYKRACLRVLASEGMFVGFSSASARKLVEFFFKLHLRDVMCIYFSSLTNIILSQVLQDENGKPNVHASYRTAVIPGNSTDAKSTIKVARDACWYEMCTHKAYTHTHTHNTYSNEMNVHRGYSRE